MVTYKNKAQDSFETRMRFFRFDCVVNYQKFNLENFIKFRLDKKKELIDIYTTQYFQWLGTDTLEGVNCILNISQIYEKMKSLQLEKEEQFLWFEQYYKQEFVIQYPEDVFNKDSNKQECYYCGITKLEIEQLGNSKKLYKKNERGWTFEIDRKFPNLEYTTENCVAACYWCNNAKTDEFNAEEFKPIGELIGKTLKARLNK